MKEALITLGAKANYIDLSEVCEVARCLKVNQDSRLVRIRSRTIVDILETYGYNPQNPPSHPPPPLPPPRLPPPPSPPPPPPLPPPPLIILTTPTGKDYANVIKQFADIPFLPSMKRPADYSDDLPWKVMSSQSMCMCITHDVGYQVLSTELCTNETLEIDLKK